ncbi:MAG: universal stress protein [Balneolales bacterium]|nr:universal stress protein [Balneolales bacterium]
MISILVATDFSEASNAAFRMAEYVLTFKEATITPIHVMETGMWSESGPTLPGVEDKRYAMQKETAIRNCYEQAALYIDPALTQTPLVESGSDPGQIIVEASKRFDLVCIATTGKSSLTTLLLGSVAKNVVSSCPVPLLIGSKANFKPDFSRILVITDLADEEIPTADMLEFFLRFSDCSITLFHFNEANSGKTNEHCERMLSKIRENSFSKFDARVSVKCLSAEGDSGTHIIEFARSIKAGLIALRPGNKSALQKLFIGSTASKIISEGDIPVLSMQLFK